MNKVKYLSSIVMIAIAWLIVSELYVWHMEYFQSEYPYVTFHLHAKVTSNQMIEDIEKEADEHNLKVFVVDQKINSLNSKTTTIYSTDDVKKELEKESYVLEGKFHSFLLGKIDVQFKEWDTIEDIGSFIEYHYIGEKEDAVKFKQDLIDQYGGKYPQPGYTTMDYEKSIMMIWFITLSFLLLLSLYQVMLEKKELVVQMVMGQSIKSIICKKIIMDISIFSLIFILSKHLIGIYGNTGFANHISFFMFGLFLVISIFLQVSTARINWKKNISNVRDNGVLIFSYIYKLAIVVCFVMLEVGCIELIANGIDYYNQREFFSEHQQYSYSKIEMEDGDETSRLRFEFYNEMLQKNKAISLNQIDSFSNNVSYIYADKGAVTYLREEIPELKGKNLENKVYFTLPENEDVKAVQEVWEEYYRGEYKSETISYYNREKIIAMYRPNSMSISSLRKKNPIIILNCLDAESALFINPYLINNTMYDINADEWELFLDKHQVLEEICCLTNVHDNYLAKWKEIQRVLIIGIGLLILMLVLEIIITDAILHYEYQTNAMEIVIKKMVGNSFYQRYKNMIRIMFVGDVLGLLLAVIFLLKNSYIQYSIAAGILFCFIEMIMVCRKISIVEKEHMNKILKGGIL